MDDYHDDNDTRDSREHVCQVEFLQEARWRLDQVQYELKKKKRHKLSARLNRALKEVEGVLDIMK